MTAYIHPCLCLVTTTQHLTIQSDNARTHNARRVRPLQEAAPKQTSPPPSRPHQKNPPPCIRRSQAMLLRSRPQHEKSRGVIMEDQAQQPYFRQMQRCSLMSNATKPERKPSSEAIPFKEEDDTSQLFLPTSGADLQLGLKPERKASLEELLVQDERLSSWLMWQHEPP